MSAEMMSAFGSSLRSFFGPVQKINQMVIAHMDKVAAHHMESMKTYTNLGIGQLKAATEVNDPWSFFNYLAKQSAYMAKVSEHLVADVQKMSQLGGDFMEKAQSVAQEEARAIGGAFGESGKSAAKKAA
jgi:phasin family protein